MKFLRKSGKQDYEMEDETEYECDSEDENFLEKLAEEGDDVSMEQYEEIIDRLEKFAWRKVFIFIFYFDYFR